MILLHGLARSSSSMRTMEKALQQRGYHVVNVNYPSRHLPIAELARLAIHSGLDQCGQHNKQRIHFVTHSLGGILVRQYCQQQNIPDLGRVVMLGPPNQGSEAADRLKNLSVYQRLNGPAGQQLGTAAHDLPKKLGAVNFELGVIAGSRSINPLLSSLFPGQNDGKVSVQSTRIDGMQDFITLPVTHTFMMRNKEVIRQTLYFLEQGRFDKEGTKDWQD